MQLINIKNKYLWGISMIGLLVISYMLCRYIFFEMHGMKQWPKLLAIVGLTIIIIATILGKRVVSVATVIGYIGGFILAMAFNTDGIDPRGGRTNNAWIIWGITLCCSILIGFVMELIRRRNNEC